MNIALITAGGSGTRMCQAIPKQFMSIHDKPVIVYTLEAFERHPAIDVILVVCLEGWELILQTYARQFEITKLGHVVIGGASGQESIWNGLSELKKHYSDDDVVLVHDGNRPMVSSEIISNCIAVTQKFGSGIACIPCQEAMMETEDELTSRKYYPREILKRTQTPHGFLLGRLYDAHLRAQEKGISNTIASCTLMAELGEEIHFSLGSEKNIKITTPDDVDIFKALLLVRQQGKGFNE